MKIKTFKRIVQAINLRPIKTSPGFIRVEGGMRVSCSRKGILSGQADELMAAAPRKLEVAGGAAVVRSCSRALPAFIFPNID